MFRFFSYIQKKETSPIEEEAEKNESKQWFVFRSLLEKTAFIARSYF